MIYPPQDYKRSAERNKRVDIMYIREIPFRCVHRYRPLCTWLSSAVYMVIKRKRWIEVLLTTTSSPPSTPKLPFLHSLVLPRVAMVCFAEVHIKVPRHSSYQTLHRWFPRLFCLRSLYIEWPSPSSPTETLSAGTPSSQNSRHLFSQYYRPAMFFCSVLLFLSVSSQCLLPG